MGLRIGVLATNYLWAGAVEATSLGAVHSYPELGDADRIDLKSLHADEMISAIRELIAKVRQGAPVDSVGAGLPGVIRNGVIEEAPNLGQLKGLAIEARLSEALKADGIDAPVVALNSADALAAGSPLRAARWKSWCASGAWRWRRFRPLPARRRRLGGRPFRGDARPQGALLRLRRRGTPGRHHGNRAIRLRFLDLEPEEVFLAARHNDARAVGFVRLWHRALAAATATSVHLDGPGRFYLAGPNTEYIDVGLLGIYLQEMVKMTSLEGSFFEIVPDSHDLALIGAAVCGAMR